MKKCILIYNPKSGKKERKKYLPKMKEIIEEKGYSCDIIFTEYHGHATEIMSSLEDVDLVISAGGDGTFNEVMTGNIKRKNGGFIYSVQKEGGMHICLKEFPSNYFTSLSTHRAFD